jgi:two-component sensor histidine kinase
MAVVLTEILQNTADHAFPADRVRDQPYRVRIQLEEDLDGVVIRVTDNGVGVPEGFSVATAKGLGLSIVRALVTSDLNGTIDIFEPHDGRGTVVELRIPIEAIAS